MISFAQYSCTLYSFPEGVEITDKKGKILDVGKGFFRIIHHLHAIKSTNKKIMIIWTGGSPAIASHFRNDLCKAAHSVLIHFISDWMSKLANRISLETRSIQKIFLHIRSSQWKSMLTIIN